MFHEVLADTGVRLYDAPDDGVVDGGAILSQLSFLALSPGKFVWDLTSSVIELPVAELTRGCGAQGGVLGLDFE